MYTCINENETTFYYETFTTGALPIDRVRRSTN